MLIGESPGKTESERGMPFVGPSGKLLDVYLEHSNLPPLRSVYRTNCVKEYHDHNPKPTPHQIHFWTPDLLSEIADIQPEIVIAIGSYAVEWCLGQSIPDLETIHGMPHYPTRSDFPPCVKTIFPVFHPAGALWNYERRSIIRYGYELVGAAVRRLDKGLPIHYRHDPYAGLEEYRDVTGKELETELDSYEWVLADVIGLDTEGTPSNPWSIQISHKPGSGLILRCSQPDFSRGIKALSDLLRGSRSRPVIAMHQASTPTCSCYDVIMCRAMGLELQGLPWFDTMYWAYTHRLEPQGNKPLCERWQGMVMEDYHSLIGDIGRNKQIKWLEEAYGKTVFFDKPSKRSEKLNTGQTKVSQPKHIHASIDGILRDISSGKETKDGPTDPLERWKGLAKSNPQQVRDVERVMGWMPVGTLDDIPIEKAVFYACLSGGSLVNSETGPIRIQEIVRNRFSGRVWSVDESNNSLVLKNVIGWHRSREGTAINWLSIESEISRFGRWGQLASRYTEDHRILTDSGWKAVGQISSGDSIAAGIEKLSVEQRQLVIGSVLGDGSLSRRNPKGWVQFRTSHNKNQIEYLRWKRDIAWGSPEISQTMRTDSFRINGRIANRKDHYSFTCPSHPELIPMRESAYSGEPNEIVVEDWIDEMSALGLAIWYQDDGCLVSGRYPRIYTLAMEIDSIIRLQRVLRDNFGIVASGYCATDREYSFGGHVMTVAAESNNLFFSTIAPYVHPCMRYKLPISFRELPFIQDVPRTGTGNMYTKVNRVYPNPTYRSEEVRDRFCIDVEDTHNFVCSSGEVAHNCRDGDGSLRNALTFMDLDS